MRRVVLGSLLGFACFACAQQQQPPGDVFESGSGAETPAQAVQKLYNLTAEIIDDPSSGYDAKTDHWPEADADWQQWDNSMQADGNALTQQQRQVLPACADHLNAAIDAAERSYRIQRSQPNNSAAQATAQKLLATARSDFAQCNLADALNGSNGNPATGANSPGSQPGAPIKGGVSTGPNGTPGTTGGGSPGAPPTTGTQPGTPPGTTPQGAPPGAKGVGRTLVPTKPTPAKSDAPTPPNVPAFEKAMSDCLRAQLPYAFPQTVDPSFLSSAVNLVGPEVDRNVPFAQLNPASQIFALETAMALQAQWTHDKVYGGNPYDDSDSIDYLVGWLEQCLERAGLRPEENDASPNVAWALYATYLGVGSDVGIKNTHIRYFLEGYTFNSPSTPPPSLMAPKPPTPLPGLIPRKPQN
jgi:hypothetical protein